MTIHPPTKVEVSYKTILFTVFFLFFLWFLYQVREIIVWVFISFILMSAFKPWADGLQRFHIPRAISILVIYIFIIAFIGFSITTIVPPLITESIHLGENLPLLTKSYLPFISFDIQTVTQQITPIGQNILRVTVGLFNNILALFTILVMAFYLSTGRNHLLVQLSHFMGEEGAKLVINIISSIEQRLGAWVRGQLVLAFAIGITTYIGLTLLGIPYTLPISILAGILEIVPIIGPIISAIPAILVALTISPLLALATTALYFIIQQAEANLLVPFVMKKAVGLPPIATIIALMAGAKVGGISGAILAIPILVTAETLIKEYLKLKHPSPK